MTVARPYLASKANIDRATHVELTWDTAEVNAVDQDTGEVLYTTPALNWGGHPSLTAAQQRTYAWLQRHNFYSHDNLTWRRYGPAHARSRARPTARSRTGGSGYGI